MFKKLILLSLLLFTFVGFSGNLKAQTLIFCESVDANGNPEGKSSVFNISSSGGYLDMLVNLREDLNCYTVKYDVYKVVNGSDVYQYTITQDTQLDWRWFWYKITFYDEGKYNIYLYDCNDYLLTSGSVRIQYK